MNFASPMLSRILICYENVIFSVIFDINKTIFFVNFYDEQTATIFDTNLQVSFIRFYMFTDVIIMFVRTCNYKITDLSNLIQ